MSDKKIVKIKIGEKEMSFDDGVKLYEKEGKENDRDFHKRMEFLNNCKTDEQKQGAVGVLTNFVTGSLRMKKIKTEAAKKKGSKGKALELPK